ncbi:hypothetical protein X734_28950 [Mesorhizobium sp. L2C084A000]|nr:hypothetical protein X734_28950 [Mesorhizobium sp. L2C084A000]
MIVKYEGQERAEHTPGVATELTAASDFACGVPEDAQPHLNANVAGLARLFTRGQARRWRSTWSIICASLARLPASTTVPCTEKVGHLAMKPVELDAADPAIDPALRERVADPFI